jgi:hypothetical protein
METSMNANIFLVGALLLSLSGQVLSQVGPETYSQKTLLKSWALSHCLARVYKDPATKKDANATASAYLEFGHQSLELYEKLSVLVEKYSSQPLSGSVSSDFNTMKCINMLNSKELEQFTEMESRTKK